MHHHTSLGKSEPKVLPPAQKEHQSSQLNGFITLYLWKLHTLTLIFIRLVAIHRAERPLKHGQYILKLSTDFHIEISWNPVKALFVIRFSIDVLRCAESLLYISSSTQRAVTHHHLSELYYTDSLWRHAV